MIDVDKWDNMIFGIIYNNICCDIPNLEKELNKIGTLMIKEGLTEDEILNKLSHYGDIKKLN